MQSNRELWKHNIWPIALRNNTVTLFLLQSSSFPHIHFFTQTLTTLDLGFNQIGPVGAQHLADALRNNTVTLFLLYSSSFHHIHFFTQTLTTLNLYDNQIGDQGAQHLADALRNNTVTLFLLHSSSFHHIHFFTQTLTTLESRRQSNRRLWSTTSGRCITK